MGTEEDERAALLRGAWVVLRRSGFDGFKVRLVLKETGLSARTFYRHFPDKDSLLVAVIRREYAATARRLADATAQAGADPDAAVSSWIKELLSSVSDPHRERRTRLFSAHHSVMSKYPEATAEVYRLVVAPLQEAIERGVETGRFLCADPESDAVQVARLVSGALNEVLAQRPSLADVGDVIESTTGFALRALVTPGPRGPSAQ